MSLDPTKQLQAERILAYLIEHPDSTTREIADALFPDVHYPIRAQMVGAVLRRGERCGKCHANRFTAGGSYTWRAGKAL